MRKSVFALGLMVVLLGIYLIFKSLGGTEEIEFTSTTSDFIILGDSYEGAYNSPEVEALFLKVKEFSEQTSSPVAVVNYGSDDDARRIRQFIGVLLPDSTTDASEIALNYLFLDKQKVIRANIMAHNFVMPKPEEVRTKAQQFADSMKISLSPVTVEVYQSERDLRVYFLSDM